MRLAIAVLALLHAFIATAQADEAGIPADADWYFHVDLDAMRTQPAGRELYRWLDQEILAEIQDDSGIDISAELAQLTSYSLGEGQDVAIFEGEFSRATRDKIMAFFAENGEMQVQRAHGKVYHRFAGSEKADDSITYDGGKLAFDVGSPYAENWFSFADDKRLVVTSAEADMQSLLSGKSHGRKRPDSRALLVLRANNTIAGAGLRTSAMDDEDWDSSILKNAEQLAFLVSTDADELALAASLVTTDSAMADSLASVVRGLIGLASFSDDMDADTLRLIQRTVIEVRDNTLSMSLSVDPELVVRSISD